MSGRLVSLRETFFAETGISLPTICVRENADVLAPDAYVIRLHEIPTAHGRALADGGTLQASSPAPDEIIAQHLLRILRRHGHLFVGIQETQALLEGLQGTHPHLVREVVPKLISPVLLADVLQRLAREGISLRNLSEILGALALSTNDGRDAASLAEVARGALCRQITFKHSRSDGSVAVFYLDSMIEETLREAIRKSGTAARLALEPEARGRHRLRRETCRDGGGRAGHPDHGRHSPPRA